MSVLAIILYVTIQWIATVLLVSSFIRIMMPVIWSNFLWWQVVPPITSVRGYFAALRDYPMSEVLDFDAIVACSRGTGRGKSRQTSKR